MPDEQHYATYLLNWDAAIERLADNPLLRKIVRVARSLFYETCEIHAELEEEERVRSQTMAVETDDTSVV